MKSIVGRLKGGYEYFSKLKAGRSERVERALDLTKPLWIEPKNRV